MPSVSYLTADAFAALTLVFTPETIAGRDYLFVTTADAPSAFLMLDGFSVADTDVLEVQLVSRITNRQHAVSTAGGQILTDPDGRPLFAPDGTVLTEPGTPAGAVTIQNGVVTARIEGPDVQDLRGAHESARSPLFFDLWRAGPEPSLRSGLGQVVIHPR